MRRLFLCLSILMVGCTQASAFPGIGGKRTAVVPPPPPAPVYASFSRCGLIGSTNDEIIRCTTDDVNVGSEIVHTQTAAAASSWDITTSGQYIFGFSIANGGGGGRDASAVLHTSIVNGPIGTCVLDGTGRTCTESFGSNQHINNAFAGRWDTANTAYIVMGNPIDQIGAGLADVFFVKLNSTEFVRYNSGTLRGSSETRVARGWVELSFTKKTSASPAPIWSMGLPITM